MLCVCEDPKSYLPSPKSKPVILEVKWSTRQKWKLYIREYSGTPREGYIEIPLPLVHQLKGPECKLSST